jgi:hypothetical protein
MKLSPFQGTARKNLIEKVLGLEYAAFIDDLRLSFERREDLGMIDALKPRTTVYACSGPERDC